MSTITDVVIVGSGALGCAMAYALAEEGQRRVIVVDRGPLVSGMTRRNAGLVHTAQPDRVSVELARRGVEIYRQWALLIGGSCGYHETGTIFTASQAEGEAALRGRVKDQAELGIDAQLVEPNELARSFPDASLKGVSLASFERGSGYVDPVLACQAFARRAREKGARFETGCHVKQIAQEHGRITHVVTTTGNIKTESIVIAAGAGAERLLMPLGVALPLQSRRGAIGFFEQPAALSDPLPTFVDMDSFSFLRPHAFHLSAAGIIDAQGSVKGNDTLEETISEPETRALAEFASRRAPALSGAPLKRAHTILYDSLPDGLPVLGRVPGFDGLYLAAGFGESAVAVAPAVGRAMTELIIDDRTDVDISAFGLNPQRLVRSSTR